MDADNISFTAFPTLGDGAICSYASEVDASLASLDHGIAVFENLTAQLREPGAR